ncbi:AAA family ATPase [uncultured Selenomonas sp.]|uniref:ParA family protein n=1 Tax=uncultured Selenomonas sp. TaxID=159275 RepID=UPI0028EB0CEF|nr:AAA family ATPase [uncultured Selenomonas sp.]
MKAIAMFNNKGGVGKTTIVCNMASWLHQQNKKVLLVDADPQCNSTAYVLSEEVVYETYTSKNAFTINNIILPLKKRGAFVNQSDIRFIPSVGFGFDVLPGDPKLASSEDFLSGDWKDIKASEIRGIRSNMVFFDLLRKCGDYDYVFFDMGPSLGAINRAVLLACDFFVTPMASDLFSVLALENIGESLCDWKHRFNTTLSELSEDDRDGLENMRNISEVKFLGYVYQQYITKTSNGDKRIVKAYETILESVPDKIQSNLVKKINTHTEKPITYELGSIPNFYSLIPMSQSAHKPVFLLTNSDGVVGAHYQKIKEYSGIIQGLVSVMCNNVEALS